MARAGYPLLMHIGDPLAAWMPLDHPSPHQSYYRNNPDWHMAGKTGYPTHAEIIAARDRMVANHPNLTIVGAHLASLEHDVDEVAKRLDDYPNFNVDISARLGDMMQQDSIKVRDFFQTYQDRILFGTDIVLREKIESWDEAKRSNTIEEWRATYQAYRAYLEYDGAVSYRGYTAPGLALAPALLDKIYSLNAKRIYRGL
jgi:predicted TIM-barrel fold metal-dependent hydrolase